MFDVAWLESKPYYDYDNILKKHPRYSGVSELVPGHAYREKVKGSIILYIGHGDWEITDSPKFGETNTPGLSPYAEKDRFFYLNLEEACKNLSHKPTSFLDLSRNDRFWDLIKSPKRLPIFVEDLGEFLPAKMCRNVSIPSCFPSVFYKIKTEKI